MKTEKKIAPIETALNNKDKIEFNFQLSDSFVIINMHVLSEEDIYLAIIWEKQKYEKPFDVFDHLRFLNNIENYITRNDFYLYSGHMIDIGLGIFVVLSDHDLYVKFIDAIREKYNELRIKILEKIGIPFEPLYEDRFLGVKERFLKYYSDNIDVLEKDILNYIPNSERWNEVYQDLCENKKLRDLILELIEKSND